MHYPSAMLFLIFLVCSARAQLHETAPRVMAVLNPLKVVITGLDDVLSDKHVSLPDFPFAPDRGSHIVVFENEIYIDQNDFRMEDSEDYYGLAVNKLVGLKSACWIRCDSAILDADGKPVELRCTAISDTSDTVKPKSTIQWVPVSTAVTVEVSKNNSVCYLHFNSLNQKYYLTICKSM